MASMKTECERLTEDERALADENRGLVGFVIKKRKSKKLEYKDQFQFGFLGLIRAAKYYKADRGNKFSTYAVKCIRTYLINAEQDSGLIRVPRYLKEKGAEGRKYHSAALAVMNPASIDDAPNDMKLQATDCRAIDGPQEREVADAIRETLDELPEMDRDIVTAMDVRGESMTSVARRHKTYRAKIADIRFRAHETLRAKLQAYA